ncbi:aldehyde dehydrogenase family protein [Nitratireductor alexandrii]|uniref:aldehyde dehydrogenase family protein n=1 Tax=Nitratireductor alexandrii TaxID=2448161 RepID=UPI000FD95879|nr:aldehyde dehydrogenase family protein [Nitratireductor alexandrii]
MPHHLFIDGAFRAPRSGTYLDVVDPAREERFAQVPAGNGEDIDDAVRAARKAFDDGPWPRLTGAQRAQYLRAIAAGIRARADDLTALETRDNGKPLPEAAWDIDDAAGCFEFYAELAARFDGEQEEPVQLGDTRFTALARREPVGVAAAIIPWNFPLLMAAWKAAPALAAGCTMVLKPSELTPLSALELGRIVAEAGVPAGVLNIVTGTGAEAGAPLTAHPMVDKIAFTGSVPTGGAIMRAAARDIKNISLELGGKSAFIVFDDASIEAAVEWILFGIFWNQGEVCSATSRLLVQEGLYERLMERLVDEARRIPIGAGDREGVLLGPLVSEGQFRKVLGAIERGREQGAKLLCGGRAEGFDKGYFVAPTILCDVPLDSDAWREEIFGPVLAVRRFATEDEAVALANDSRFGLAAAVMSQDRDRAARVARALRAGIVWVNCSQPTFTEAPWGGYKQSGIGRELGRWGFENYLETKQITEFTSAEPWGWYLK